MKKLLFTLLTIAFIFVGVTAASKVNAQGGVGGRHGVDPVPAPGTTTFVLGANLYPFPAVSQWKLRQLTPTTAELNVKLIDGTKFNSGSDTVVEDVLVDTLGNISLPSSIGQLPVAQWTDDLNAYYAVVKRDGPGIPTGICASHLFVIGTTGPVLNPVCLQTGA